jgi:hypothetical protein
MRLRDARSQPSDTGSPQRRTRHKTGPPTSLARVQPEMKKMRLEMVCIRDSTAWSVPAVCKEGWPSKS